MFLVKSSVKMLFVYLSLVKFTLLNIGGFLCLIADLRRLYLLFLGFITLLLYDNCKCLKYMKSFLCLLPITLALLVTSLAHATNEDWSGDTAQPPVTMFLNGPNDLNNCLTNLNQEKVIKVHDFLKKMVRLDISGDGFDYDYDDDADADGDDCSRQARKKKYQKYYDLYNVLSLRYYEGQSVTSFLNYMIHNKKTTVINHPLMEAMLKLCDDYKDHEGITIGNMFAEVENKKHTDENIQVLLRYKSNDVADLYFDGSSDENVFTCCDGKNDCANDYSESIKSTNPIGFDGDICNITSMMVELSCDGSDAGTGSDGSIDYTSPICSNCVNGKFMVGKLHGNGENNCAYGSDASWNCPAAGTTFTEADALLAGGVVCAAYVTVALVKYRDKKRTSRARRALAWFLSPITEPVNYLRRLCDYDLVPPQPW
ncbi:MAG: hypothetical protein QS748_10855 [Candidatus Endonucleobacter bathymodioli]|uniref:Uncharacterized protein n=1 Tax=Candidatus Endonucleibacter bathymodioli TaxID=539814 RepID=A0AA90STI3_9GAMM|nr:hypothetical protein [Candidatus Endonucleobacter bathymodioli]